MAIRLPTAADPVAGLAVDGAPMALVTIPGTPNDPTGPLCIGTDLLDGVPQSGAGSFGITAVYVARGRDDATLAALRQLARDHLAPIVAPISAVAAAGAPRTLDLAPYVTDPAGAGYSVAVGALPPGLSASVAGSVLTYSSAVEASYTLPLTFTSLHGLAPARSVTAHLTLASEAARWPNGYRWRAQLNFLPWPNTGTAASFLLPFAEVSDDLRSVANGGKVESDLGWDLRIQTADGVKIPHVLLGYDPSIGLVAGLMNISDRNFGVAETAYWFAGKPGLTASEENRTDCRAGGWLWFGSGHSASDFSGQSRSWTTNNAVGAAGRIGAWPAGTFNGSTSYRARASGEMNGLAGLTVVALVQSAEGVGRTQEFLNVAPADVADLALRLGSGGNWVFVLDAGGVLQAVQSEAGLYYPGRAHAVAGVWTSGGRPTMYVDGALVDPVTPPAVATGTTAINEVLELGRGNRPPGTASLWNGLIGPVLGCNRGLSRPEVECLLAGLAQPRLVYGLGSFKTVDVTATPPIARPVDVSVEAGTISVPIDVQAAAYNPDGLALTTTVGAPTAGSASIATGGKVLLSLPAAAANQLHYAPYSLTSGLMSTSSIIRVRVAPVVVDPGPDPGPAGLPAGYPTPPSFTGAETVNVSNNSQLQAAINSAPLTGAGRVIALAAGVNYGTITINRSTAKIKLVCNTPRFSSLITDRATLDSIDLTVKSNTDQVVVNNCIPGGLRAHSATARVGLSVTRCGILWVEGLDFHDPHKLMVNRQSGGGTANGVDQLWVRRCSFSESDTNLIGLGGTSNRGADIFVAWENYLYGDGVTTDTGPSGTATGGVITDYPMQFYKCGDLFVYKCIFQGGANHSISTKLDCGPLRVDDCVFANFHQQGDSWKNMELGQEGSPTGNDRTCGLTTVKGCTFTAATGTNAYRVAMLKDVTGFILDGCIIYDGPGGLLDVLPAPAGRSGPNDEGVLAGSQGILIQNCTFGRPGALAQPGACNLNAMYTGSGGGYVFTARNNQYSALRAVNKQSSKVSTSYGPNPGFSG